MKGRLEHELRTVDTINLIIRNQPKEVKEFYYNLQVYLEPMTCLEYIRKITSFLSWCNKDINTITDSDVVMYFNEIKYINKQGEIKRSSFSYNQGIWTALNKFFIFCVEKNYIPINPLKNIKRPNKKDDVKRYSLDIEELNSILSSATNGVGNKRAKGKQKKWAQRDYFILYLFMVTGMRKTALTEINIEDISFTEKELVVIDKRRKIIKYPITAEIEAEFRKWLIQRDKLLKGEECDALFISNRKQRISEKAVYEIVKKYSEDALGFNISPHKFRSSFITLYYEASGGDIEATKEAAAHESISTTSLYINRKSNARVEAANYMSASLKIK